MGKLATTAGTMLFSRAVYAGRWGWASAAGFIDLLLVHEMGHYVAARHRVLDVGAPTFIPFVGAWIVLRRCRTTLRRNPMWRWAPLVGTFAAVLRYLVGQRVEPTPKAES